MPTTTVPDRRATALGIALALAMVGLALTSAYIHAGLGGILFTLNALGYVALSAALAATLIPHPLVRRFAWLPRVGLAAYAVTTIAAYLVMGPYFTLGWIAKAVEVVLVALVAVDLMRAYGSPAGLIRAALSSLGGSTARGSAS